MSRVFKIIYLGIKKKQKQNNKTCFRISVHYFFPYNSGSKSVVLG